MSVSISAKSAEMSPPLGPDYEDTKRRIRAAIAWAGSSREFGRHGAAEAMGVRTDKVDRMVGTKPDNPLMPTWDERWALADAVGLPREWFSADLARLHEILLPGAPAFAQEIADARQRQADALRVQAPRSGEHPEDVPETKPARSRRRDQGA
jgi:hypothetical protein